MIIDMAVAPGIGYNAEFPEPPGAVFYKTVKQSAMNKMDDSMRKLFQDYFEGKCSICGGTTWVVEEGGARRCECFTRDYDHNRKAHAGIPPSMLGCTLKNYYPQNPSQMEVLTTVGRYVRNFEEHFGSGMGLLLRGPVGTGKTHLAAAALRELVEKGYTGLFLNFVHVIEQIRLSFDPNYESSEPDITARLRNCHVVVMDELGAVRPTDFVFDKMYDIINQCLERNVSVIFTTNYRDEIVKGRPASSTSVDFDSLEELARPSAAANKAQLNLHTLNERIGERLRSRILGKCVDLTLDGKDYRLRKRNIVPKGKSAAE